MPRPLGVSESIRQLVVLLCILSFGSNVFLISVNGRHPYLGIGRPPVAVFADASSAVIVTTSADIADGDTSSFDALINQPGPDAAISFREAILASNAMTNTNQIGIAFHLPISDPGYNSIYHTWTITIGAQALPAFQRGDVIIDGTTQPDAIGYPPIILDGFAVFEAVGESNGLTLLSAHNIVRGLALINFYDDAIRISGSNAAFNQIVGNYIGLDNAGTPAFQLSENGVHVLAGAHDNMIGGDNVSARNLIAGNAGTGVLIAGEQTHHNTVAGNWIGVAPDGQTALANAAAGVLINTGARDNLIGGAGQGNLIAGNDVGVYLDGGIATTITGNSIGVAADQRTALANTNGGILMLRGSHDNVVGGSSPSLRNIVSGNGASSSMYGQGIYLSDANTISNTIQGNYIGVDGSGNLPLGNYAQGVLLGPGAEHNLIGGVSAGEGNVIAYNGMGGIRVDSANNQIAGNLIGIGANGITELGNQLNGVRIGEPNNIVGPNNLIAYNQQAGIWAGGSDTAVISNTLLANATSGICVTSPNIEIRGNVIDSNGNGNSAWLECALRSGVVITGTTNTLLSANHIFFNNDAGITVYGGVRNRILSNSMSGNLVEGIQLLNGGNNDLAPPIFDQLTSTTVRGSACAFCYVEVFMATGDQGSTLIGSTTATSNGAFAQPLPSMVAGTPLTATHTDPYGNTSPFAPAARVPTPAPPPPTPTIPPRPAQLVFQQFIPSASR